MRSIYAYTEEIDDLKKAVAELKHQVEQEGPLMSHSYGIVNCDYEVDTAKLAQLLKEEFDFPVMGCTAISMLNVKQGHTDLCISMMVMTADDCVFQGGITKELWEEKDLIYVEECYKELHSALPDKEKLIFIYTPFWENIIPDNVTYCISDLSGKQVPIYGGIASDGWDFHNYQVFYDGKASKCGMIMLLVSGNIHPITRVEHSLESLTDFSFTVTASEGNKVISLNNNDIIEVLASAGLYSDKDVVATDFLGTPFLCTRTTTDGDEVDTLKSIYKLNHAEHTGVFLGNVQAGTHLCMGLMSRNEVEESVGIAIDGVLDEIWEVESKSDYRYSTIICTSCAARYNLIVADKQVEARAYQEKVPSHINLFGYYSYGEMCPVRGKVYDRMHNETHNETFAILAL